MAVQLAHIGNLSKTGSLLILHGLFGSKQNWSSIVKSLNSNGLNVAAIDLRNHGTSGWADDMDLSSMTKDVMAFLDKNDIQNAHFMGHSLGGKVAMNAALEFPDRVQSLISVDMSLMPKDTSNEFLFYIKEMKKVSGVTDKKNALEILSKNIENQLVAQFLLTNLIKTESGYKFRINLDALEMSLPKMLADKASTNFKPFKKNVLFIGGSKADYINPSHHDFIRQSFPTAKFEYLETGHWVHFEKPIEFMKLVVDFIKNN